MTSANVDLVSLEGEPARPIDDPGEAPGTFATSRAHNTLVVAGRFRLVSPRSD